MSKVEKNKNLFIVTLDNGKQTYFNFSDNHIYGLSGRPVKKFNADAIKIMEKEKENNFLALFFYEAAQTSPMLEGIKEWDFGTVETLYSLYGNKYTSSVIGQIGVYCYKNHYKLDSKGAKTLTKVLEDFEKEYPDFKWLPLGRLHLNILEATYPELSISMLNMISKADAEMRPIILEDIKKITFYYEHENWDYIFQNNWRSSGAIYELITTYIRLCEQLHHERTYKDFFRSLCRMKKEAELLEKEPCAAFQKEAPLFYENDSFTVIIPTTPKEFKIEADYQRNCVFRLYYPRVVDEKTHVVFIRRKEKVEKPFITCEVSLKGNIIQYLGRFNEKVMNKEAREFKEEYQTFLHEHFEG